jgi:hypothetical protein
MGSTVMSGTKEQQWQALADYQSKMRAFTAFLKELFAHRGMSR